MERVTTCSICNVFEMLQLPWLGNLFLMLGGVLAVFSLVVWPLLIVWPLLFILGFGLVAGHGACVECHLTPHG
ncbi:MAG: hypothetical protein OCC46_15500 [Pseudodesulfovibrio sp.]